MRILMHITGAVVLATVVGCASMPAPTQRMADAEAATRSAKELGADAHPQAKLELKLADEQIAAAKRMVADGENERADLVLVRARADAELALALVKEQQAVNAAQHARQTSTSTINDATPGATP
ncbi:MAG TPA: DUF4398 domain-containing protein [Byssovorax sp.]|jgi:hypothetical protein